MERIKDVSLAQRAADAIKTSIIEGKYNQGEKITEEECAKNLGLSRICVREAFGQLAAEGLLVKEVNRCTRVASFTKREIEDVLRLRVAIERLCIAQCRERKSIPEVSLRQSVERMGELAAKGEGYEREQMREDFAFHAAIVDGAGNTHAAKVWHGIEGQILTMLYPAISEYKMCIRDRQGREGSDCLGRTPSASSLPENARPDLWRPEYSKRVTSA